MKRNAPHTFDDSPASSAQSNSAGSSGLRSSNGRTGSTAIANQPGPGTATPSNAVLQGVAVPLSNNAQTRGLRYRKCECGTTVGQMAEHQWCGLWVKELIINGRWQVVGRVDDWIFTRDGNQI